jgi:hypothetical protein
LIINEEDPPFYDFSSLRYLSTSNASFARVSGGMATGSVMMAFLSAVAQIHARWVEIFGTTVCEEIRFQQHLPTFFIDIN